MRVTRLTQQHLKAPSTTLYSRVITPYCYHEEGELSPPFTALIHHAVDFPVS